MPPKFKEPEFVTFDSTGDPCAHLHMFCRKMAPYGDNHPLLYQIFPDSLTSTVATWYVRLEKTSSWREMASAFLEYYWINTEIVLDRTVLQRTEKKSGESFREYAQRWFELSTQMLPPMTEDEMIKWFIDNLEPPYYEKIINAQVTHFASLILIGEDIDVGIRSKKIVDPEAMNSMIEQQVKKAIGHKRKEGDVYMIDKTPEGSTGVVFAYSAPNARPYQQQREA